MNLSLDECKRLQHLLKSLDSSDMRSDDLLTLHYFEVKLERKRQEVMGIVRSQ